MPRVKPKQPSMAKALGISLSEQERFFKRISTEFPAAPFPAHIKELLRRRYLLTGDAYKAFYDKDGDENWNSLVQRVVSSVVSDTTGYFPSHVNKLRRTSIIVSELRAIFSVLIGRRVFLPNSPTLFGAGVPGLTMSACYVVKTQDSIEGWAETFKLAMKIQCAGGGCGFAMHQLRPHGFPVRGKRAKAAGPIEFMHAWNAMSKALRQAVRDGANMGLLRVDHPDIEDFIKCKSQDGELSAFNISVGITDEFINAARTGEQFPLRWEGKTVKAVSASRLWESICEQAHKTGEPGVVFLDSINRNNPLYPEQSLYVNPCLHGSSILETLEHGSKEIKDLVGLKFTAKTNEGWKPITRVWKSGNRRCVNLEVFRNGEPHLVLCCTSDHLWMTSDGGYYKAHDLLGKTLHCPGSPSDHVVTHIDDVGMHDVYDFTQPETHNAIVNGYVSHNCSEANLFENSACNLGSIDLSKFIIDGKFDYDLFAKTVKYSYLFLDMLINANNYVDPEIEKVVKKYRQIGLGIMGLADVFLKMGVRYGSAESIKLTHDIMSAFERSTEHMNKSLGEFHSSYNRPKSPFPCRNFTTSCVAPTGSLSQIAGCQQGIEPYFSLSGHTRKINGKDEFIQGPELSKNPDANVDAMSISVDEHLHVVAAVQEHIDMSVSKTVNLKSDATIEDVQRAYERAYELGIKGITVYRDGARKGQILTKKENKPESVQSNQEPVPLELADGKLQRCRRSSPTTVFHARYNSTDPIPRPDPLRGHTLKYRIGCGNLYVTVNYDASERIVEVFVRPGKAGGCTSNVETLGRIVSMAFRSGVKVETIIEQLGCTRCQSCAKKKNVVVKSCSDAIARAIRYVYDRLNPTDSTADAKWESAIRTVQPIGEFSEPPDVAPSARESSEVASPSPVSDSDYSSPPSASVCPECGKNALGHEGGCVVCRNCDYTKCG